MSAVPLHTNIPNTQLTISRLGFTDDSVLLTVAKKWRVMKSYSLQSESLICSRVALRIGVMGGWSPASVPVLCM